ncbi:transmembrane protein 186 [Orussus abietinus]|uniref:transmembrane protein 186 n=1 Tax=Orussus abietinus TaxID=222816 RepID=UPI000624F374|nr:transmembrane protein 186 [Orussus abietinus]
MLILTRSLLRHNLLERCLTSVPRSIQYLSTVSEAPTVEQHLSQSKVPRLKTIYKLPFIKEANFINKMKFHHTVVLGIYVPVACYSYIFQTSSPEYIIIIGVWIVSITALLYSLGHFCNNLIGFIYYNEHNKMLRLSYVATYGGRKDLDLPLSDIVGLSPPKSNFLARMYENLRVKSPNNTFKLNLSAGKILDYELFETVLKGNP